MPRPLRWALGLATLLVLVVLADQGLREREDAERAEARAAYPEVRGVWRPVRQVLESGEQHAMDGRLLLGETRWQTLHLVLDRDGAPRRGTAEGGSYRPDGDTLRLAVSYRMVLGDSLPGMPPLPLQLSAAAEEPASVPVARRGDTLAFRFPGWGRIDFVRVAERVVPDGAGAPAGWWEAERYLLADGGSRALEGRIVFGAGEWQVVYLVLGPDGTPARGSAEGGPYRTAGDTVVFLHRHHLAAGETVPGAPTSGRVMTARGGGDLPEEPSRFEARGDTLTLFFPSGNRMRFRREGAGG